MGIFPGDMEIVVAKRLAIRRVGQRHHACGQRNVLSRCLYGDPGNAGTTGIGLNCFMVLKLIPVRCRAGRIF
jgi:hypothetical protein